MVRVLAFSDYFAVRTSGGAEKVAREVYARLIREHGVELVVVAATPRGARTWDGSEAFPRDSVHAFPGYDLSRVLGAQLTVSTPLLRAAQQLVRRFRPTVLHANGLHFQGSVVAAHLARSHGLPLVSTAHLGSIDALGRPTRLAARTWDHTLGRYIVTSSTALVPVSPSVANHLRTIGGANRHLEVALNGVDHEVFHPLTRGSSSQPDPSEGTLRVGLVGRAIANKGPDLALDAVGQLRRDGLDVTLDVVGDGPLLGHLEGRARREGLGRAVTFSGHVQDVAERLRALDVVLRPSYTEGLPLAVLEAMASGAVVVASSIPGNTDLVEHEQTGLLVPPGDALALAAAVRRLHADRQLLGSLRRNALAAVSSYTWDASAASHLRAIEFAVSHHDRRRPGLAVVEAATSYGGPA
jgi:glycosyltransferase involved in cell wall biosynthesis